MPTTIPSSNLVEILHQRSSQRPDALAYRFLPAGEIDDPAIELTYGGLDLRARAVAAKLQSLRGTGERALMLYPAGLDFMVGFFGCLYAGAIAVPAYPPDPARLDRTLQRLRSIVGDCKARFVITTSAIKRLAATMLDAAPELDALTWIATDEVDLEASSAWQRPALTDPSVAFLQYTSGSTGDPKGVVVTHANLAHNEEMISQAFGEGARRDHVAWLPLYHDMGLIGKVVHAPYAGVTCTFLSPLDFLRRPSRWLRVLSRTRAGFSAAPNFAYELCVRKIDDRELGGVDLSHWSVAVNAAEPVRSDTLERFTRRFAPLGFRREAFAPAYGLAEGTLLVTAGAAAEAPATCTISVDALERRFVSTPKGDDDVRTYVSCGRAWGDQTIRIVDPDSCLPSPPDGVGEIWVSGGSIGAGYWNRPDESARTFQARLADSGDGPFLRTGDLGFIRNGELHVSGRLKDLIILRGRNHLPNDIEHTVECANAAVRGGCTAAFSVDGHGEEALVLVAEVEPGVSDLAAVASSVRQAVADGHDVQIRTVVFVEARTIPKTTSGKIQRRACRAAWTAGRLRVVQSFELAAERSVASGDAVSLSSALGLELPARRLPIVQDFIRREIAGALRQPLESVDPDASLVRLGLDSLGTVELRERLESTAGVPLPSSIDASSPTPRTLSEAILGAWLTARLVADPSSYGEPRDPSHNEEVF